MSATEVDVSCDSQVAIIGIDELQNYGINVSDLQKLKASGVFTVNVCYKLSF